MVMLCLRHLLLYTARVVRRQLCAHVARMGMGTIMAWKESSLLFKASSIGMALNLCKIPY